MPISSSSATGRWRRAWWIAGLVIALVAALILVISRHGEGATQNFSTAPACVAGEEPRSENFDAATKNDPAFARSLRHCFTTVDGVQMHYVIGGSGPQPLFFSMAGPKAGTSSTR